MNPNQERHETNSQKAELARGEVVGITGEFRVSDDFPTQRGIINYFKTQDPKFLTLADSPIYSSDKEKFASLVREGKITPDHAFSRFNKYNFLEQIPTLIDNPGSRLSKAEQITGTINSSGAFSNERIILKYLFSDQTTSFSGQRLADILKDYPTPEMMNDLFAREIARRFGQNPERQRELLESADTLLTNLYGKRQKIYTQFRLLVNQAFEGQASNSNSEQPSYTDDQNEPRPSRFSAFSQGRAERRSEKKVSQAGENARLKHEIGQKDRLLKDALGTSQTLIRQNEELQRQLATAQAEITNIKAGRTGGESKQDPDGRFALLGLDPRFFSTLPDDEYIAFLESHRRTVLKALHPDKHSGVEDPRVRTMNDAIDELKTRRKPKEKTYS